MKRLCNTVIAALVIAAGGAQADESKVPPTVRDAFAKAYPQAVDAEFETETRNGKTVYEVEFRNQGQEMEALFSPEGALLRTETEVAVDSLPDPVKKALAAAHPTARIKEAERLMKPDGTVFGYEVELKDGKRETTVELDGDGKIVSTEAESEDD
ncbi:MAG: hypothetical protein FJ189_10630 [Gammaproteobacteria bacterium]|nr:hypothetical protein [Gammaproteobacteria bacterium]